MTVKNLKLIYITGYRNDFTGCLIGHVLLGCYERVSYDFIRVVKGEVSHDTHDWIGFTVYVSSLYKV